MGWAGKRGEKSFNLQQGNRVVVLMNNKLNKQNFYPG
jgi:hypothetical protein